MLKPRERHWTLALMGLVVAALLVAGPAFAAKSKTPKVDLNTAAQKELEDLPGVGEATAKKIIAGRPYSKVADLEKAGVAKSTIDKISKLVTVSKPSKTEAPAKTASSKSEAKPATQKPEKKPAQAEKPAQAGPIDLNSASQKELEDLPGVGPATAKKIIAGRPYSSVDDLAKAGVSKSTIGKIRSQVTVAAATAASKPKPAPETSSSRAPAPASASAPAPSSAPSSKAPESKPVAATAKPASAEAAAPSQAPPEKGMVWVNTATKVYHYEGDRWYGNTKEGKYMTEAEAIQAGYRASKQGKKKE